MFKLVLKPVVSSPHIGDFLVLLLLFSVGISNKATMHQCILFISCVKCVLTAQNVFLNFDMFSDFTVDMVCCLFYRCIPCWCGLPDIIQAMCLISWIALDPQWVLNMQTQNRAYLLSLSPLQKRKEFWSVLAGTPQLTLPLPATKQCMCFCSWNLHIYIIVINNPMLQSNSNFPGLYLALMECQFSTFGFISLFLVKDY